MRTTLLTLCLSVTAWSCAQRPPIDPPLTDAGTDTGADDVAEATTAGPTGPSTPFTFSSGTDATSRAVAGLVNQYQTAPTDQASLQAWLQAGASARAAIHADPDAVTTLVLAELQRTPDELTRKSALFEVLREAGTQQALDALGAAALEPIAHPGDDANVELDNRASYEALRIHRAAIAALGRAAQSGNERARAPLTRVAVEAPSTSLQQLAIDAVLQTAPVRRRAKAELAAQLPVSQHYLLHGSL